jgi:hypothetical protein
MSWLKVKEKDGSVPVDYEIDDRAGSRFTLASVTNTAKERVKSYHLRVTCAMVM